MFWHINNNANMRDIAISDEVSCKYIYLHGICNCAIEAFDNNMQLIKSIKKSFCDK